MCYKEKITPQELLKRKEKMDSKEKIADLEKKCSEYYLESRGLGDDMEILRDEKERLFAHTRNLISAAQELMKALESKNEYQRAYAKLKTEVVIKDIEEDEEYDLI